MAFRPNSFMLISVPLEGPDTFSKLKQKISSPVSPFCEMTEFPLRQLKIGTLENLMKLSDELIKLDSSGKSLLERIKKTYFEGIAEGSAASLQIGGLTDIEYFKRFKWNEQVISPTLSIEQMIDIIKNDFNEEETNYKKNNVRFTEIRNQLQKLRRTTETNLISCNLNEFISPDSLPPNLRGRTWNEIFIDRTYLLTICVVFPKSIEKEFISSYESFGKTLVIHSDLPQGPISPVVPRSAIKLIEYKDQVLYTIVILRPFFDQLKSELQKTRYVVRLLDKDINTPKINNDEKRTELEHEEKELKNNITIWCRENFKHIYELWSHIKILKIFVESVLRYGVKVEDKFPTSMNDHEGSSLQIYYKFISLLIKPNPKYESKLEKCLFKSYESYGGTIKAYTKEVDSGINIDGEMTQYPFACVNIERLLS